MITLHKYEKARHILRRAFFLLFLFKYFQGIFIIILLYQRFQPVYHVTTDITLTAIRYINPPPMPAVWHLQGATRHFTMSGYCRLPPGIVGIIAQGQGGHSKPFGCAAGVAVPWQLIFGDEDIFITVLML